MESVWISAIPEGTDGVLAPYRDWKGEEICLLQTPTQVKWVTSAARPRTCQSTPCPVSGEGAEVCWQWGAGVFARTLNWALLVCSLLCDFSTSKKLEIKTKKTQFLRFSFLPLPRIFHQSRLVLRVLVVSWCQLDERHITEKGVLVNSLAFNSVKKSATSFSWNI